MEDLVEQILLRLPPKDPACLVRASVVCKPWRRLVAGPAFRRRYREFHRRPHLLGVLQILQGDEPYYSRFVPTSVFRVVDPVLPCWLVVDCRHGRALFATTNPHIEGTLDLVVWEPMTDDQRRVPQPSPEPEDYVDYAAAVAFVSTDKGKGVTSARLYSSETGAWNETTSLHHPEANAHFAASVHVGDALYFRGIGNYTIEYQLTTARLSVLEALAKCNGRLVTMEDGGLGFAAVDNTIITLWARETGPEGAETWTHRRVIDLKTLLSEDALSH
ncbi:unnamed protein product [Triticum turgidum subsp. durum]|uniref:F-box domain-containing protein n=1 Tax=Triticum turgidum subsp. durum TaxID=4567 RepID=A0A9R1RM27_TRITD|nr:unnamed protein product [Triticum turgidum subsp. durum]